MSDPRTTTVDDPPSERTPAGETGSDSAELVESDLLVEEISIDGMCGVY